VLELAEKSSFRHGSVPGVHLYILGL
jgi:hypothetical protein